ncbi:hypothetical protein [Massilia sp. GCM10023247]|uniref:hypothetical protein n=1 Tax=Massilia sp. GCM10023247 TaxID=3252643 RepID=UPI0036066FFE
MKKQISCVSLSQNAKMVAALYLAVSLPIVALFAIFFAVSGQAMMAGAVLVVFPVVYAGTAFLGTLVGAWFYNLVAARVGGFEFTTKEIPG